MYFVFFDSHSIAMFIHGDVDGYYLFCMNNTNTFF